MTRLSLPRLVGRLSLSSRLARLRAVPLALLTLALLAGLPGLAQAKGLPKPHVSPALDAVLMPITAEVRREFKLGKKAAGAVVVAVDPGGTAELYGMEPGDVITQLDGKVIRRPVDIDTMVKYALGQGNSYFFFDGTRKNRKKKTIIEIPAEAYAAPIAIETLPKWRGYNAGGTASKGKRGNGGRNADGYFITGGGGFFYADFCDVYYEEFYEVYDYTLVYVEEIIVTEVFITAYSSTETVFWYDETAAGYDWPDEEYIAEVDEYVYSDEFYAEYTETEVIYEDQVYDPETGLTEEEAAEVGVEFAAAEDAGFDDSAATEDVGAYEEPVADEPVHDEPAAEEPAYEEPAAEEPVYEEPAAEEPLYEEPAAEEPVYEEPAAEEPIYEEPAAEEPIYEEPAAEEPIYEEPAYEEPAYEEPAYEEPAYEEPAYEEPAYEEPAYEEPAYEEPAAEGGSCYYDDEGNEICG